MCTGAGDKFEDGWVDVPDGNPVIRSSYKIVGDNIDKNIHFHHQSLESQGRSLHYFHSYAILDRFDCSTYSDEAPPEPDYIDVGNFLPDESLVRMVLRRFTILIERYNILMHLYVVLLYTERASP